MNTADTLVLNRHFYAVHVTDWRRALALVYCDHARVVDEEYRTYSFADWRELSAGIREHPAGFVRTPTLRIAIPEVIALRYYDRLPPQTVKFTRRNIYEHYGYRCAYCGSKFGTSDLNLEHVVPRSRGGRTDWTNVVTACVRCNVRKGDRLPEEAGMQLLLQATKPRWRGAATLIVRPGVKIRTSWQRFVDNAYWNAELDRA